MSCRTSQINRIFMVIWHEPQLPDITRILDEIAKGHREIGNQLLFVAVMNDETVAPAPNVRKKLDQALAASYDDCESFHFIIEGSGFKHAVLRTVLAANILASGKRGKMFVASSMKQAVADAPPHLRIELHDALSIAQRRGFVKAA